jgi:hypothetical protein
MKVSVSGLIMEKFQRIGLTKGKNPVAVGDANEPFEMQMAMNNLQRNSASQTKKNQLPASGRVRERCGSGTTCDGLIKAMRGNIGRPSSNRMQQQSSHSNRPRDGWRRAHGSVHFHSDKFNSLLVPFFNSIDSL